MINAIVHAVPTCEKFFPTVLDVSELQRELGARHFCFSSTLEVKDLNHLYIMMKL